MNKKQYGRRVVLFVTILCLLTAMGCKKEFVFKGRVEKVDPNAKTIVVNNEAIPGWRFSMTMTYTVDNVEVLTDVRPGDRVTAKVYEGDFKVRHNSPAQ